MNDFGKFHNKTIQLRDGINLIYGDNEAGKSTIHSFVRGMLFGIEKQRGRSSKDDFYTKYQPWDTPGAYQGSLDVEIGTKTYRIYRNFDKNNKDSRILDLETGRERNLSPDQWNEFYGGLTEAGFRNTVSIEQLKARTEQDLAEEVRNYITNLSMSKSNEVDVSKALNYLQAKRKELESQHLEEKIQALEEEIHEGISCEDWIDALSTKQKEAETMLNQLSIKKNADSVIYEGFSDRKAYQTFLERYPVIQEKYKSYCELKTNNQQLKEKLNAVNNQIDNLINHKVLEKQSRENEKDTGLDKKKLLCMCILILSVLFGMIGLKTQNVIASLLCFIGICASGMLFSFFSFQSQLKIKEQKKEEYYKRGINLEHMEKLKKEYQEQVSSHVDRIRSIECEIIQYFNQAGYLKTLFADRTTINNEDMKRLEDYIAEQKQSVAKQRELIENEYEKVRIQLEKLKWELESLEGNEDKLLQNQDSLKKLQMQKLQTEQELAAVKLAIQTISELSVEIHDSFGLNLNQLVSSITQEVTNNKYSDIKVDEKLSIKVNHKDHYVLLDKLSSGTIEQIYFALRTAVADLMYGKGVMPLLLDDCFALYDDNRTKAALSALVEQGRGQVLVFTCHHREQAMFDQMNADYHYIDLSRL